MTVRDRPRDFALSDVAGPRIAAKRRALKWTRQRLAEECQSLGITMSAESITNIESGRRSNGKTRRRRLITIDEIAVIAEALEVPATWLTGDGFKRLGETDAFVVEAADKAPSALGDYLGDAVAVVLLDHSEDETPDPNIHELAYRVLMMARLGGGES